MNRRTSIACALVACVAASCSVFGPRDKGVEPRPLSAHYELGEIRRYRMTGINESNGVTRAYEALATGEVKCDAAGVYYEEWRWTALTWDGKKVELAPASLEFRQILSLDPGHVLEMPNISRVDPGLFGPIFDLMTFYVDLWLADHQENLREAGDHVYVENGKPNSWASPQSGVLIGEDSIDFDLTLTQLDRQAQSATLLVKHVPPRVPKIQLPAAWMKEPVADTPNNWVQVMKTSENAYVGSVGKETFDVELHIAIGSGRIVSAVMDNPVEIVERECSDAELTTGEPPSRSRIHRHIEITSRQ